MTEQKVSLDRNDFIRQTCKIDKCPNWTCRAYDSICLHHITHKEGLLQDPREFSRRMTMKGNFGFRMHDGTTFAAVFHGGVFVCDGPGEMRNPLKQAERAEQIEKSYVNVVGEDDQSSWAPGSKRYLFAVMNGFDDFYRACRKGAVYDSPQLVKDHIFDDVKFKPQLEECVWPGSMDLYIFDPTIPEEMDFLVSIMEDVPDKRCFTEESLKWWTVPFKQAEWRKEFGDDDLEQERKIDFEHERMVDIINRQMCGFGVVSKFRRNGDREDGDPEPQQTIEQSREILGIGKESKLKRNADK